MVEKKEMPLPSYTYLGLHPEAKLSDEEKKRALQHQPRWKRFWIFFGGPLFNFLFAIFIYMVILVVGEPQVASVIGRVVDDSPAAQAGFRTGDRILEVAGKKVEGPRELQLLVASMAPGSKVDLKVLRDGKDKGFTIELGERPATRGGVAPESPAKSDDPDVLDGVTVADIDAEARKRSSCPRR